MRVKILDRLEHDISEEDPTDEEDSDEVKAKEDSSESDLQRWKGQGPGGWLRKDDGTDMNEEDIDEECARWDAMVREARNEKEAGKGSGFYIPSVYSEHGKNSTSTAKYSANMIR